VRIEVLKDKRPVPPEAKRTPPRFTPKRPGKITAGFQLPYRGTGQVSLEDRKKGVFEQGETPLFIITPLTPKNNTVLRR